MLKPSKCRSGNELERFEKLNPLTINPIEFWLKFKRTDQIIVPPNMRDWLIGQDDTLERLYIGLEQFEDKILKIEEERKQGRPVNTIMRERPGPYFFMVGKPGTGKSLIGKILGEEISERYKAKGIEVQDVLCLKNKVDPYRPKIITCRAGLGTLYERWRVRSAVAKAKRKLVFLRNFFVGLLGSIGMACILWFLSIFVSYFLEYLPGATSLSEAILLTTAIMQSQIPYISMGTTLLMTAFFAYWILGMRISGTSCATQGGGMLEEYAEAPSCIVRNVSGKAPFIKNLSVNPSEIFGDIEWDPLQAPGMGRPVNKRVTAGDIHKANGGVFFLDEFKTMSENVAVRLLSALEDGEMAISYQGSGLAGGGTSALNVKTDPVPCVFFLLAAGNQDVLNDPGSILNRLPQFRNRFEYGGIIPMNDDMLDNAFNRMKIAQFVADEAKRFDWLPFNKDGVYALIEYLKRRADWKNKISLELRFALGLLQDASNLSKRDGKLVVTGEYVERARLMRKPIEVKQLESQHEQLKEIKKVKTVGSEIGRINGVAVVKSGSVDEGVGQICTVKAFVKKVKAGEGDLIITGVSKSEEHSTAIEESLVLVRTAILKKYGVDLVRDTFTHVDFVQSQNVDGPSAGITMLLAIESCLENIPLRQDVAVTGKVEIIDELPNSVFVSAIGGVFQKVEGAERMGLKAIIIPSDNFRTHPISDKLDEYKIKILHADNDSDYLVMLRAAGDE